MHQTIRITALSLRSIVDRPAESLAACVGVASAVAVLVSVLAMAGELKPRSSARRALTA